MFSHRLAVRRTIALFDTNILECAVAGHAGLIVSGDKDLLVLGTYQGTPIITGRQFLDSLAA
jgi:predicted nucleic acid-binding protein